MMRTIMVCIMGVIFLVGSASMETAQFFEAGVEKLQVPIEAPDFTLRELGGGKIFLKGLRGKIILLNFFAPWCEVCQREASSFDKLDEVMKKIKTSCSSMWR